MPDCFAQFFSLVKYFEIKLWEKNRGRKSCEIVPLKEDTEIFCFLFAGIISVEVLEEQSGPRLPFLPSLGFELSKQRYLF